MALGLYNIIYILLIIGILWQLYTKAGKPGWASFVPVYGSLVLADIAKKPVKMGWIIGITSVIIPVYTILGVQGIYSFVASVVYIIVGLIVLNSFIKQYSAGIGRWLVFIFLPFIGIFLVKSVTYKGSVAYATPASPIESTPVTIPDAGIVNPAVQAPQNNNPQPPLQ